MRPSEEAKGPLQVVWIDPVRQALVAERGVRRGDILRYEFPGSGQELPLSCPQGIDVQLNPAAGLVYRAYRSDAKVGVPRHVCDLPLAASPAPGKDGASGPFWRPRGKTQLPVPLLFAARPDPQQGKVTLDVHHRDLSVAYLRSSYDAGVVLSSKDALLLLRVRAIIRAEWLALELRLDNVYGPALTRPPLPVVTVSGGQQLAEMAPETANRLVADNPSVAELSFDSVEQTQIAITKPAIGLGPLHIGTSFGYQTVESVHRGKETRTSVVHPVRWNLFMNAWDKSHLEEGAWRSGQVVFSRPEHGDFSCSVVLKTGTGRPFAKLA